MPRPRNRTKRLEIKPLGVAERIGDAPPTRYTYRGSGKPDGGKRYVVEGVEHQFDGGCHADCPDVR